MAGEEPQTELHPLVGGFTDAEGYDRARPRYDAGAAALLVAELDLQRGLRCWSWGPAPGSSPAPCCEAGLDLVAVEPLDATRTLLAAAIGAERVRAGRAEEIPLPDASVQAVMAADAFHWFDERLAMPEIRRVLRPGGGVAILRTAPAIDEPWSRELGELIMRAAPRASGLQRPAPAAALEEDPAFGRCAPSRPTSGASSIAMASSPWSPRFSWVGEAARMQSASSCSHACATCSRRAACERAAYDVLHQIWVARLREEARPPGRPDAPAAATASRRPRGRQAGAAGADGGGGRQREQAVDAVGGHWFAEEEALAIVQPIDCSASTWSWLSTPLAITVSDRSRPNTRIASSSQLR